MLSRLGWFLKVRVFRNMHDLFQQMEACIQATARARRECCLSAQPQIRSVKTLLVAGAPHTGSWNGCSARVGNFSEFFYGLILLHNFLQKFSKNLESK